MSKKKLYIVSIHSHGGSFWEASGTHRIVELTEKELKTLNDKYQYKEIAPEQFVCITPIEELFTATEIESIITTFIRENDDSNELEEDESIT